MLSSLEIKQFRAFEFLKVDDLDRINLFVGKNNSGKTTILEAAEILLAEDSPAAIVRCAMRRGEMVVLREQDRPSKQVEVSHLFHGHTCEAGRTFVIAGDDSNTRVAIECEIGTSDMSPDAEKHLFSGDFSVEDRLYVRVKHSPTGEPIVLPLSASRGLSLDYVRRSNQRGTTETRPVSFIRAESLDSFALQEFWDSIALTDEEGNVIQTLKILEPTLDRIAFLSPRAYRYYSSSGGIYVKLKNAQDRIPLGSLGDGIRHLLTMALALGRSQRGSVMIDEIDTGLHHSIMADMWRVLIETAVRLDVQVFATTHSQDCVRSLAWLQSEKPALCSHVRLHRVDSERDRTVVYGPDEIEMAAKQHVELRG